MSISFRTNIAGLGAQNSLAKGNEALSQSLNRISTGRRINRAADDASGMMIANSLNSQARSMGQAMLNANDAISISQIADGALGDVTDILDTIHTKAIQAANDSQSPSSRQAIQADISKALEQLDQIVGTTEFNGQKLLSGDFTNKQFQVGAATRETMGISISSMEPGKLGTSGSLADIDVTTYEGAQNAIKIAEEAIEEVNTVRSGIGSTQNQLTSTISNLSTTRINIMSSESQIADVDLAEEVMNFSKIETMNKAKLFALGKSMDSKKQMASVLDHM